MKKLLKIFIGLAIIGVFVYAFRNPLQSVLTRFEGVYLPCEKPILYTLGSFDPRFGISKSAFLSAITEAEAIWEKPIQKNLFDYALDGNLKINLIYDFRQEATQKLKALGIAVGDDKASYLELKSKYDAMQADYVGQKSSYDARVSAFQSRQSEYEAKVTYWNKRGGAPRATYDELQAEKASLSAEAAAINALQANLNEAVVNINAFVVTLNRLVAELNLNVEEFNAIGQARGAEFEEGVYMSDASGAQIVIYQFDSHTRLVRVLAHELGHALQLPHVSDPKAIMYRLNSSTNEKLTPADLTALKAGCGIK